MTEPSVTQPENTLADAALARIRIVLVGTQHPGNIGSAARAIKTMGLSRLVLVAPERAPDGDSFALAAGAADVLDTASTHPTLSEAVSDCRVVLGCTARDRRIALDGFDPRGAGAHAWNQACAGVDVALVFGRERTGLTNEELHLCHGAVHIPSNPAYGSLNLAMAVQVIAYEVRMVMLGTDAARVPAHAATPLREQVEPPASHAQMEGFYAQLAETLNAIDFHKGRAPASAMRKLRRIFGRAQLDERELRLLRGVLSDAERMAMLAGRGPGQGGSVS